MPKEIPAVSPPADERAVVPIVGLGSSAGGLEALEGFFTHMPSDAGLGFVVVTHQHVGHTSLLPELLSEKTDMNVVEATDGVTVKPNHVYVAPPGGILAIDGGRLSCLEGKEGETMRLPIDSFFRSLAEDLKEKAVGIILSGTGTDGTLGLKAIKEESGMAMVQEVRSAQYTGMPSSAIATGLVDYVMPPAELPAALIAYVAGPYLKVRTTRRRRYPT